MATNKKSVILYCDIIYTINELSDEEAGKLFKHYLAYINDLDPIPIDKLTQIVFEPIKQQLKRDLIKWEDNSPNRVAKAKKAGIASGVARELKRTQTNSVVQNELGSSKTNSNELNPTKRTANVNVNVIYINIQFLDFWDAYGKKTGSIEKLKKKWGALSDKDRSEIMEYIPKYRLSQPDVKYRLNPETFLNGKRWNDEIITENKKNQTVSEKMKNITEKIEKGDYD
jgi:hypothetical protein